MEVKVCWAKAGKNQEKNRFVTCKECAKYDITLARLNLRGRGVPRVY